ncbi:MAG: replicative DNA helicase [Flavobacteriales bacterium]|jgi:replicative DNA helicase|nr:replicative DNA helicase [Flavobacteriales bacterium]
MSELEKKSNNISYQQQLDATDFQLVKGKLPPQALEMEKAVLGAIMIDKEALNEVVDILRSEAFYDQKHQIIYETITELFGDSQPIDILTISESIRKKGEIDTVGGEIYLMDLTQKVTSSAHIEYHARIILQKYLQRRLIHISSEIITDAFDEKTDVIELLDTAESKLYEVANGNIKKSFESAQDLVRQAIKKIAEIANQEGLSGVPTGFLKLDKLTAGWQPSDLIILAARPGMGKTAFVLSMARNMAVDRHFGIAFFSLEMSSVQLITRLISAETGLTSEKLRKGNLEDHEWQQLMTKVKALEKAPIFIDDTPGISIFDLRAKCRRLVSQHDVRIIIIDYLQLMTAGGKGGNREQEISTISRSLKGIAKELNVPVIALSQLSRAVETRTGSKRPLLSDLRESGAIEQDADIVSFIYRPEYYKQDTWDDDEGTSCIGQAEFIVAKHRNGGLENIRLKFEGQFAKFDNLEEEDDFTAEFSSKLNSQEGDISAGLMDGARPQDGEDIPF